MVEKGKHGEIYHSIYQNAKANKKHIKDCNKNKQSSYIQYWVVNKLMVEQCCKSFQ